MSVCKSIGTIHEDVTTDVVGEIGPWQWLVTFLATAIMVPALFNQYEDMFLLQPVDVECLPPQRYEVVNSSLCFVTYRSNGTELFKCNKWHMMLMWLIWIKKTWLVFCDHKQKLLSIAIISRLGSVFGSVIFGLFSDSFGRKPAIIFDLFASFGLGLMITFCDSEGWFRLLVFLKSLFGSASCYIGLILICEIASNRWRSWLSGMVMTPRLLGLVSTVPIVNTLPNSETYSFIACLFDVLCIVSLRWSPESPQWLLYNLKIHIAENTLLKAAKKNGIRLCNDFKIRPVNHRAYNCLDESATCVGILTTYNIRIIFMVSSIFWMLYYFLWSSLYVRVYSEEQNLNYLLLKVLCFVGLFVCLTILLSIKLTLRHLLSIHVLITGASTAGVIFLRKGIIRSVISSVALASGVMVHALILNCTPRLFAINIRATLVGCCHATGQLGSIISYLLFLFHPMSDVTFLTVEIGVTLFLVGLCSALPDVDSRELPDVMEDMDYYSELSKPLRWVTQKTSSPSREEIEMRIYSFGSAGRALSTHSHSEDRIPARPIGFLRLWRTIVSCIRRHVV